MSAGGGKCKCVVECEPVFLNVCARFSAFVCVLGCVCGCVLGCVCVGVCLGACVLHIA